MSYNRICQLLKLFYLFFYRNVLNFGILSKKAFRCLFGVLIAGLIAYFTFLITNFFISAGSTIQQTSIVLDTYCCSVIMFTFIVFLFMKVIFMKKGMFVSITQQMPVTRKELNCSMLIYEMSMTLLVVILLSASMAVSVIISNGILMITRVVCNVIFTAITTYFILELLYEVLTAVVNFFRLEKLKNILLICTMAAMLYGIYVAFLPAIFQQILFGYQDNKETSKFVFYSYLMEKIGFLPVLGIFLIINLLLAAIILLLPNNICNSQNVYLHTFNIKSRYISIYVSYIYAFARNADVYSYYFISLFVFIILKYAKMEYACFALLLLTVEGIYAYVQSEELRQIIMQKNYSIWKDYFYIVGGQFTYICVFSLPILLMELLTTGSLFMLLILYLSVFCAVIFFTMIGIIFPAKQENPFSALLGMAFIIVWFLIIGLVYIFVNKNFMLYIMITMSLIVAIFISFIGMKKIYDNKKVVTK